MSKLRWKFEDLLEDVNQEDGIVLHTYGRILEIMFSFIMWLGIPFVVYLLIEVIRW